MPGRARGDGSVLAVGVVVAGDLERRCSSTSRVVWRCRSASLNDLSRPPPAGGGGGGALAPEAGLAPSMSGSGDVDVAGACGCRGSIATAGGDARSGVGGCPNPKEKRGEKERRKKRAKETVLGISRK